MKEIQATVVKHTGSHYMLACLPSWKLFPAVVRGKIRLQKSKATNPIAVGDHVRCQLPDGCETASLSADNPAVITEVMPRSNYVIRKSTNLSRQAHVIAANIDRAFIVVTLAFPEVKLPFLDRLLVTCEVYGVPVTIVLNKVDLLRQIEGAQEFIDSFTQIYEGAGYEIIQTCAKTGEGVDRLRSSMADGINLLSGVSGVGKSSLIKALDPTLEPKTGEISSAHLQGKHTTTFYEMYQLSSGGYIIDTPGIRSFGLVDLEPHEVAKYFPEMLRVADDCRFTPCTHTHEPSCAVKQAVDDGEISVERYNSYLGMLEEYNKYR
ncbi:MAG: ribosome small subunit-dependent GTPase A [Bacteroidales bacterium]|nr:ribosome small subunit-dependent GTPase A [Bacteroidales bacterium]